MAAPDKVTGGIVIIGGVLIMTIFAGLSEGLGKVLLIVMFGFLLLWLMTGGAGLIQKWTGLAGSTGSVIA